MILTDLEIGGEARKVILHAPKNGFFYVVDRTTGAPISATPFVDDIRWATGIDPETWRPVEVAGSRYVEESFLGSPHVGGAHNWQPMAFSPQTGLVYIPTTQNYFWFNATAGNQEGGGAFAGQRETPAADNYLQALDPLTGEEVWRVDANGWEEDSGGGGALATAGNLVFQGRGDVTGELLAIRADTGEVLWRHDTPNSVMAAPVSYLIDGEQYIAVSTGGGGGGSPIMSSSNPPREQQPGRMVVFRLGGTATLPPAPPLAGPATDPDEEFDPARVAQGAGLYGNCMMCHGVNGRQSNIITDLRRSPLIASAEAFQAVVHDGALLDTLGMPSFEGRLTPEQIESIRQFMGSESQKLAENQRAGILER
jgi:mono/diheme cytochrome c family protein